VYAKAKENLSLLRSDGSFIQEEVPSLYLYELTMEGRVQIGVVGCVHVDDYAAQVIRKHETTRQDKEDDRTLHILTSHAHAEPVFLTYPTQPFIGQLNNKVTSQSPLYDFVANDGVRHRLWRIGDPGPFVDGFRRTAVAYIADGHHRCAGAWRAAVERRKANPSHTGAEEYNWFLAVLFPSSQLRILAYNRVVRDLNGLAPQAFLDALARLGTLVPGAGASPEPAGSVGVLVGDRWYRLTFDPGSIDQSDPVASLDVALLQERVLGPILGVGDVRTDPRIDFVGGVRGTAELERRVAAGEAAVGFALDPVSVQQLMAIADAGAIMPPKSTWFEPKLLSGLFVHTLD
jgi:uncharacterized protein (DUF1015 family)